MAYTVQARKGDSLCSVAIREGFNNCSTLRTTKGNEAYTGGTLNEGDAVTIPGTWEAPVFGSIATGRRWTVRWARHPIPQIRLLRGAQDLGADWGKPLTELRISNYVSGSADRAAKTKFPAGCRYDPAGYADPDAFQVVVWDPFPWKTDREARLQALAPVYANRKPTGWKPFAGEEGKRRSLTVPLRREGNRLTNTYFRSAYLRLVVDEVDAKAMAGQGLLVTHLDSDAGMEILDQNVLAVYPIGSCEQTGGAHCVAWTEVPLARGTFVRLAVRVLRGTATGKVGRDVGGGDDDGFVKRGEVQERVDTFCRRVWAQAQIQFDVVRLETVDFPSHMLAVGEVEDDDDVKGTGKPAKGEVAGGSKQGEVGFTITMESFGAAKDTTHAIGPLKVAKGWAPDDTAAAIKEAIDKAKVPDLEVKVSPNPKLVIAPLGKEEDFSSAGVHSVDVLLLTPAGKRATISALTPRKQQDADQPVRAVAAETDPLPIWNDVDRGHIGSPAQRNIAKCLDTGDPKVIDVYVVDQMGANGQTIPASNRLDPRFAPCAALVNTLFLRRAVAGGDAEQNNPYTLPHEIGHVLTDCGGHDQVGAGCLMNSGATAVVKNVLDTKRIPDFLPEEANWEMTEVVNFEREAIDGYLGNRIRAANMMADVKKYAAPLLHADRA